MRTSTERPEVLDKGSIVIGGVTAEEIARAVGLARALWEDEEQGEAVADYRDENVSAKVVRIIQSYTGIVERVVWGKR